MASAVLHVAVQFSQVTKHIDEDNLPTFSNKAQYEYLLELVLSSCLKCAELLSWDKDEFLDAYNEVPKKNFSFYLDYSVRMFRDKRKSAFVRIEKTEQSSILYLNFIGEGKIKTVKLFEKLNWFWYDSIYDLAKNSKWLDVNTFGVTLKKYGKHSYYSLTDDVIIGNVKEYSV